LYSVRLLDSTRLGRPNSKERRRALARSLDKRRGTLSVFPFHHGRTHASAERRNAKFSLSVSARSYIQYILYILVIARPLFSDKATLKRRQNAVTCPTEEERATSKTHQHSQFIHSFIPNHQPPTTNQLTLIMDEEESFSSGTALMFAVLSFIIYWIFLRPTAAPTTGRGNSTTTTMPTTTTTNFTNRAGRPRPRPPAAEHHPAAAAAATPSTTVRIAMSEAAFEILSECQSKPKHVASSLSSSSTTSVSLSSSSTSAVVIGMGGSNVILSDSGLVAFCYTEAAASVVSTEAAATVRHERAKILSRLCKGGGGSSSSSPPPLPSPPCKGSTVVLSISQPDVKASASTLAKILYDLGTFYNLVVILAVSDNDNRDDSSGKTKKNAGELQNELVEQLRSASSSSSSSSSSSMQQQLLSESVLPSHRILLASTVTGRVALVRQLAKVAMVVDWDPEVESQLTRFGYKVALVPNWSTLLE
jgi:hypothetical protein